MSTEPGVLRHTTSAVVNTGLAALPTDDPTTALDEIKSKITYIWNPSSDINLIGPEGLLMRLGKGRNFYGQGKPKETLEDYLARKGNVLRRCFMYPLWNINYIETAANTGDFTEQDMNAANDTRNRMRFIERGQFAGVCAADFISRYGESHGARALVPLLGMDGPEQSAAEEIFKLVQPSAFKLDSPYEDDRDTLLYDLTYVARERIAGADLDEELEKKAEATRVIMLGGVKQAITSARQGLELLDQSMADAKLARPGKSRPTPADEHICFLLGEAPPAAVARPIQGGGGTVYDDSLRQTVSLLSEMALRQQAAGGPEVNAEEARQLVAEMRAEREAMQQERLLLAQERDAARRADAEQLVQQATAGTENDAAGSEKPSPPKRRR